MTVKIGLIGGRGQMGRWFQHFFASQGLEVLVADLDTEQTSQEVASLSDVVMLAVPIPEVAKTARALAPHLQPQAALMDLTSVKQAPMDAMMAHFPGEVVGTHPLFGPLATDIAGQTVVLCPGRGERWFNWLQGSPYQRRGPGEDHHRQRARPPHVRGPGPGPFQPHRPGDGYPGTGDGSPGP